MNAEQLQDALNQLPDDLLIATDALRQKKKQPLRWNRVVPMAACFVLVLGVLFIAPFFQSGKSAAPEYQMMQDSSVEMGGAQENAAPADSAAPEAGEPEAPMEQSPVLDESNQERKEEGAPKAPDNEEQAVATGTTETPVDCYGYCIGATEPDETVITVISTEGEWQRYLADNPRLTEEGGFENGYGEDYFREKQLIVVVTTAASSSVRYELDSICRTGTGTWELTGTRYTPEWFTDDMTQQCILVELPRMVEPEDTVTLNLTDQ